MCLAMTAQIEFESRNGMKGKLLLIFETAQKDLQTEYWTDGQTDIQSDHNFMIHNIRLDGWNGGWEGWRGRGRGGPRQTGSKWSRISYWVNFTRIHYNYFSDWVNEIKLSRCSPEPSRAATRH